MTYPSVSHASFGRGLERKHLLGCACVEIFSYTHICTQKKAKISLCFIENFVPNFNARGSWIYFLHVLSLTACVFLKITRVGFFTPPPPKNFFSNLLDQLLLIIKVTPSFLCVPASPKLHSTFSFSFLFPSSEYGSGLVHRLQADKAHATGVK